MREICIDQDLLGPVVLLPPRTLSCGWSRWGCPASTVLPLLCCCGRNSSHGAFSGLFPSLRPLQDTWQTCRSCFSSAGNDLYFTPVCSLSTRCGWLILRCGFRLQQGVKFNNHNIGWCIVKLKSRTLKEVTWYNSMSFLLLLFALGFFFFLNVSRKQSLCHFSVFICRI